LCLKNHFTDAAGHNLRQKQHSDHRRQAKENTLISQNSSLSSPTPLEKAGATAIAGTPRGIPEPSATIASTPVEFSGTGGEYFRIWIVNLLLIMVTFGIYYPWAKVRKLKYFYNNTRIDDHAMEFHGEAKKMLRGSLIVGVFFIAFSHASDYSVTAGLIAALVFVGVAPALFRASMRFRLANTSWRGMRMRFVAQGYREAYACVALPLAMVLLPSVLIGLLSDGDPKSKAEAGNAMATSIGAVFLLLAASLPYFFWRIKRYQHNHYAWGPLKTEYRSPALQTYKVFGMTILMALLIVAVFAAVVFMIWPSNAGSTRSWSRNLGLIASLMVPLFFVFIVLINILPRAYFTASMQNLLWSRTGNRHFRFKSELPVGKFIGLQFKNYFLILITLGFYWPFAVVATQRMKLEALSLKTRVALDKLFDAARARENDAAGDMAADIFGFDVGM
jgi:uncharacterized membrane protein YjgN (DUF898 family)